MFGYPSHSHNVKQSDVTGDKGGSNELPAKVKQDNHECEVQNSVQNNDKQRKDVKTFKNSLPFLDLDEFKKKVKLHQ